MEENAPRPVAPTTGQQDLLPNKPDSRARTREQTPQRRQEISRKAAPSSGEEGLPAWPFVVLVPVLLGAATPLTKRALVARGRPEDLYRDLTGRLRDVLPPGKSAMADSPALTPTERILLLAGAAGVDEGPMRGFARSYTEHLYSPAYRGGRHVSSAYREALLSYERLPGWRRALGAANPASLLARAGRGLSASRTRLAKALRAALRGALRRARR
jgi:hypothetical protein